MWFCACVCFLFCVIRAQCDWSFLNWQRVGPTICYIFNYRFFNEPQSFHIKILSSLHLVSMCELRLAKLKSYVTLTNASGHYIQIYIILNDSFIAANINKVKVKLLISQYIRLIHSFKNCKQIRNYQHQRLGTNWIVVEKLHTHTPAMNYVKWKQKKLPKIWKSHFFLTFISFISSLTIYSKISERPTNRNHESLDIDIGFSS